MNLTYEQLCKKSEIELNSIIYGTYNGLKIIFNKYNNNFYIQKEKKIIDYDIFYKEVIKTIKRLNLNQKYLQKLIDYSTIIKIEKNKTIYIIRTYFEYFYNNLYIEINSYLNKDYKLFSQEELIKLFYQSWSVMYFLQLENRIHGNLRLEMIRINYEKNYILVDNYKENSNYPENQVENYKNGEKLYLSPELFDLIKNDYNDYKYLNYFKNEVFSLGLIFLECSLLKFINLYENNRLNIEKLNIELNILDKIYQENPLIVSIIKNMLEIDFKKRPDFIDLLDSLPKFSVIEEIYLNKNKFNININKQNTQEFSSLRELQKSLKKINIIDESENNIKKESFYEENFENNKTIKNFYNNSYKKPKISQDLIELQQINVPKKKLKENYTSHIFSNSVSNKQINNQFRFRRYGSIKPSNPPLIGKLSSFDNNFENK